MNHVHLHIDRLVIEGAGWDRQQAQGMQAALETELVQLLMTGELATTWQAGGAVPSLPQTAITWQPSEGAAKLGQSAGQAIFRSIGK